MSNERLSQELRNRADQAGGHPISLDDVKRSATKMKWQQRAAAGAVAVVVLAIGVPVGIAVTNGQTNGSPPVAPSPTVATLSPTPTPTVPAEPLKVTVSTDGKPRGGEPQVLYVHNQQIVLPDGSSVEVAQDYSSVTRFGEGFVGQYGDEDGNVTTDILATDGTVERSIPSSWGIAVAPQAEMVAFFEDTASGGALKLYGSAGEELNSWSMADGTVIMPVGILAGGSVVYEVEGTDSVTMLARAEGDTQPLLGVMAGGGTAFQQGLVSGMTSYDELVPESCWNIFTADSQKQWSKDRCQYTVGRFSPDERLALGHPSYRDGLGERLLAILDAETGKALVEYDFEDGSWTPEAVWEDDTHVLARVYGPSGWHIMRFDLLGNVEDVSGALPGDDVSSPVQLGAAP